MVNNVCDFNQVMEGTIIASVSVAQDLNVLEKVEVPLASMDDSQVNIPKKARIQKPMQKVALSASTSRKAKPQAQETLKSSRTPATKQNNFISEESVNEYAKFIQAINPLNPG
jgi:hypothetical protein